MTTGQKILLGIGILMLVSIIVSLFIVWTWRRAGKEIDDERNM